MSNAKLPDARQRAWWSHKQGLDGSLAGSSAAEVFARTGWARSVAGVGPYLTLFARAGLRRAAVDAALERAEIHELPSARGCTYVLPAEHFALGLRVGQPFNEAEFKTARKLGVSDPEIATLRASIAKALQAGPLEPDAIRTGVGSAARSLGPEGVKKGLSTTVPLALGVMQSEGEIRRIPTNGRLDNQRYKYTLWQHNPLANRNLSEPEALAELARLYYRWTGPASVAEFQWFSGLGAKTAKAVLEPLALEALSDGRLLPPEDREAFETFRIPKDPQYALVSSLDTINQLRRDVQSLLADEDRAAGFVHVKPGVADLPNHAILDRGRLIGLWEYDTATESIAWLSFVPPNRELRAAVSRTEDFIREDLGDARSFSLDSPKSRAPKIALLRAGKSS